MSAEAGQEPEGITAVILCGGKGERLRPFTERLPKPLVLLGGVPLLHRLIGFLADQGVRRCVVCTGHLAGEIERSLAGLAVDCELVLVDSGDASMCERIIAARAHVPGRALIVYGDTLANVDLGRLEAEHRSSGALATVTVYPLRSPFGIVEVDQAGRVRDLLEKPVLPHWINIGFVLCEPGALDRMQPAADLMQFLTELARTAALHAHRHRGRHLTVNTDRERRLAEEEVEFFTYPEGTGA